MHTFPPIPSLINIFQTKAVINQSAYYDTLFLKNKYLCIHGLAGLTSELYFSPGDGIRAGRIGDRSRGSLFRRRTRVRGGARSVRGRLSGPAGHAAGARVALIPLIASRIPCHGQGYLTKTVKYLYLTKIVKIAVPLHHETHHQRPFRRHGDD